MSQRHRYTQKGELGCWNCDGPCLGCWEEVAIPTLEEADAILKGEGLDPQEVGQRFAQKAKDFLAATPSTPLKT